MKVSQSINENKEIFQSWLKGGIIPCSANWYWLIWARYDAFKKMGKSETIARSCTCEEFKVSEMTISRAIKKMESIL
jgi:hypothetical protein